MLKSLLGKLTGLDARARLEQQVRSAREHLRQDRPAEALGLADRVLAAGGSQHEAHYVRGSARLELGNAAAALADLERAVELRPDEPPYLFNLAVAHWSLGNAASAVDLCRKIIARHDFIPAHDLLANIRLHGESYFEVLHRCHGYLRPAAYLEIGVAEGASLRLANADTRAIGIDPAPDIGWELGPEQKVFAQTSDDFFARHDVRAELGGRTIDMAFIDGMHHFEFALRDFANIEKHSRPDTVVFFHDCWPLDRATAERERVTRFWTGDIWRMTALLKKHRPDLEVRTIGAPPTGLGVILNLDPSSNFIFDNHDRLVEEYLALDYSFIEGDMNEKLGYFPNDWNAIRELLDGRTRALRDTSPPPRAGEG